MAKISKQLYVTVQYRGDAKNEDGLLGFASPYTKDAPFNKRKSTQDSWAYGYGVTVNIDDEDNITVTGEGTRGGYGASATKWDSSMLFMANCYPRILNNEPIAGFQIAKSVRRYGWGGSGNVKWRISDPRGFDLEISSENFANVISCCTMNNGVIQEECVWGREGNNNILLPVNSAPFAEATEMTSKINTKISLKDLQVGDTVEILSNKLEAENSVVQYLGKYFFLEVAQEDSGDDRGHTGTVNFNTKQTDRYVFKLTKPRTYYKDQNYLVLSTPKVVNIIKKIDTPLDKNEVAKEITESLRRQFVSEMSNAFMASPTKFDLTTVKSILVPITEKFPGPAWPGDKNNRNPSLIVCKAQGKSWLAKNEHGRPPKAYEDFTPTICQVNIDLDQNKITVLGRQSSRSSYYGYGSRYTYEPITEEVIDINALDRYYVEISANGMSTTLSRIGYY